MARYDNEPRPYAPDPKPERNESPESRSEDRPRRGGGGSGSANRKDGGGTLVPRREWFHYHSYGPAEQAPKRYRHEDFGSEKPAPKGRKKLGSGGGIGAVPRSPLPPGMDSITVFCPELLTIGRQADARTLARLSRVVDAFIADGVKWWEDKDRDVPVAANLSREDAERICTDVGLGAFLRMEFGTERDSFRSAMYTLGREGFREGRVHRVLCINPPEILEVAERTVGVRIPKIPEGIMKN